MGSYNFLGQNIVIGSYSGIPTNHALILEMASAFSVIGFFQGQSDGLSLDSKSVLFQDQNGNNTFGLAYQHTNDYGFRCFFKVATTAQGFLLDGDAPPKYPPWNGWEMLGTQKVDYAGIADPDNPTLDDLFLNSFMIFQQDGGLYPYYYGPTAETFDALQCRGNAQADFIICTALRTGDGQQLTEFTGVSPFHILGGSYTNWLSRDVCAEPSYTIGNIGYGSIYSFNPLHIDGSDYIDDFTDDAAGPGGGGTGDYGYRGDSLDFEGPISLNALDTGLISLFSPTKAQLRALSDFLWSDGLVDNLKKAIAQPMDAIIMAGIVPLDLSSIRDSAESSVVIGNVDTEVGMYKINQQVITVDMGSVTVSENWKNALDYEPFSDAAIYLPGIGFAPLKLNEIMSGSVHVQYLVDLLSGDCVAHVKCSRNDRYIRTNTITYIHRGNLMINIPLTGADYSRFYKTVALAPLTFAGGVNAGNPVGGVLSGVASATSAVLDGPQIQRSGNFSGSISGMMYRRPFILLHRPIQQLPKGYSSYVGYPSYIRYKLSDLSGYTMVDAVIDNTVSAPDDEKAEIERLLKEGVIL